MCKLALYRLARPALWCLAMVAVPALAQTVDIDAAPRLRLVEEQRIGSQSDPNLGFTNISSVAVDRDGNVYAFDIPAYSIKVFSASGRFLRVIGRQGQGPGEFETTAIIGIKGDTLWARTRGGAACISRVVLFRRDGTYLSSTTLPAVATYVRSDMLGVAQPIEMLDDGRMVSGEVSCFAYTQSGRAMAALGRAAAVGGGGGGGRGGSAAPPVRAAGAPASPAQNDANIPRVRFNLATRTVDTIGWFLRPGGQPAPARPQIMVEGRGQPIPVPPRDEPLAVALRDGRVIVERAMPGSAAAATVRVVRTGIRGDTLANVALRYVPAPYTRAALDSIADRAVKFPGSAYRLVNGVPQVTPYGNPAAAHAAIRAEMKFPPFQIPVTRALAGVDGTIWLRREDTGEATVLWHVLERNGQPRGTAALPRTANPAWISASVLWVVQLDEDDVPWLIRLRLMQ